MQQIIFNVLYVFIAVSILLLLFELLLRISVRIYRRFHPVSNSRNLKNKFDEKENSIPAFKDFIKSEKCGLFYQDFVGYLQYPFKSANFNINSHGFRCPEFTLKKMAPNRYRILVFGASALLGVPNCSDHETVTYFLQENFDGYDLHVEVINLGISSYKIMNELNLLYRLNLDMEFDAIIIFDGYNDIFDSRVGNVFGGYKRIEGFLQSAWDSRMRGNKKWFYNQLKIIRREKRLQETSFLKYTEILLNHLYNKIILFPASSGKNRPSATSRYDASRKFYLQHAGYFINFAKEYNKKIMFAFQPTIYVTKKKLHPNEKIYYDYSRPIYFEDQGIPMEQFQEKYRQQSKELKEICLEKDVQFLDLISLIDKCGELDEVFHDYCHLTPLGNKLIAENMFSLASEWFI